MSSMHCNLCDSVATSFAKIATRVLWSVIILTSLANSIDEVCQNSAVCLKLLFLCYSIFSVVDRLLLANVTDLRILLSGTSSLGQLVPSLVCSRPAPSPTPDASVSRYSGFVSLQNSMQASTFMLPNESMYIIFMLHVGHTTV